MIMLLIETMNESQAIAPHQVVFDVTDKELDEVYNF